MVESLLVQFAPYLLGAQLILTLILVKVIFAAVNVYVKDVTCDWRALACCCFIKIEAF